jgi:exopolyphosphatase/guanosine-5'-triphosphate,3'-diphosphate pyrophosphatase
MTIHAVIDIGTNSVKMHVADVERGRYRVVADVTEVTRLGEGLHASGVLSEYAMERTALMVARLVERARGIGAVTVVGVGTMALRTAGNRDAFRDRVRAACGLDVEVIGGEEEARLAFVGGRSGLDLGQDRICIFDTGGGSTEFIYGRGDELEERFSLNVGCRAPTERYLRSDPVTAEELRLLFDHLDHQLGTLDRDVNVVLGIGGTVTSLAAVHLAMETYDADRVHGSILTREEVQRQVDLFAGKTIAEREDVVGLMPKRADVILAGAAIVRSIMEKVGVPRIRVSDRGLRHGVMVDRFGG